MTDRVDIAGPTPTSFIRLLSDPAEIVRIQNILTLLGNTAQLEAIRFLARVYAIRAREEAFVEDGKEPLAYFRGKVDGASELLALVDQFIISDEDEAAAKEQYRVTVPPRSGNLT